jgi:hypothetical protein
MLHQIRIEARSPWQWRVQRPDRLALRGLETYRHPHAVLYKGVAEQVRLSL